LAQVPYNPVPSEALQDIRTPEMQPRVPAAAFGGEVAQAVSGLGRTVAGAGDEIFSRAIALQNLQNEAEATEADAKYMQAAGDLHAEFNAKQGKERVDAYPKYKQDLDTARQSIRGGLSSPMSQKMFDRSSLSTMGRSIFNSAGVAAEGQRQYVIQSAVSQSKLDANTVSENPDDPNTFQDKLQQARKNAITISAAKGNPEGSPQEQLEIKNAVSNLYYSKIDGKANKDPYTASKWLTKYRTELNDEDLPKLELKVRNQARAIDAQNIANEIYNEGKAGPGKPGKSAVEMEEAANARAKEHDPDDPVLAQHTRAAVQNLVSRNRYNEAQEDHANTSIINRKIVGGVASEQELRADPVAAKAADDLIASGKKLNLGAEINNYNTARDRKDNMERFNTIMGSANNDVESFLNYNPRADQKLSQSQINSVIAKQEQFKKQIAQDPRVDRAMSWLRTGKSAEMGESGLNLMHRKGHEDDYDRLTGAVQSSLDIWIENHNKPPSNKEFLEQIAPQLLQEHAAPGTFGYLFGGNKEPFFKPDTSTKDYINFAKSEKQKALDSSRAEPTDAQLDRAYTRVQLLRLYPGKATGK